MGCVEQGHGALGVAIVGDTAQPVCSERVGCQAPCRELCRDDLTTLGSAYKYSAQLTGAETEAQRGSMICLGLHSW